MAKLPSGRFPFINLRKALDRAQAIYENDKGGKGLKVPVAFAAWGYSDKSSGGFQTVAALKHYGLLADEGANDDRAVKLTGNARTYFQTEIEDDKAALREAFAKSPPLMAHLLDHWEGGTVDDPVARTYLKTSLGMNEQSARSALGIYKENLSYVRGKALAKPDIENDEIEDSQDGNERLIFGGARVGDLIDWEANGVIGNPSPMKVVGLSDDLAWVFVAESNAGLPMNQVIVREKASAASPPRADAPANPFLKAPAVETQKVPEGYRSETFDADEGTITISWPSDLSTQSVQDMKDWLELLKRRIERRATDG